MNNISIKEAAKLLSINKNLLFVCHKRPDGDTLGSAYGLKLAMEANGHNIKVLCDDVIPDRLKFIEKGNGQEDFVPELICSIDVAETELMGQYGELNFDLKLDHHGSGKPYAKNNHIDGGRAACGEIIYDVIRELERLGHATLTPDSATSLYAAIASDTGCFKYANVTSSTMRIAAELIDAGADCEFVCKRLFETKSMNEIVAERITLNNVKLLRNNTAAFITFTNSMKSENGISDDDIGGIGSYLREIEGIELSVVIKQSEKDISDYRISMRSGANVNASELCSLLGGGGHARAAGGTVRASSPEEAERKVIETSLAFMDKNI